MNKFSFKFYYFFIFIIGAVLIFVFARFSKLKGNYDTVFTKPEEQVRIVTKEVSFVKIKRSGQMEYVSKEVEYNGDINNLANKTLDMLFEMNREDSKDSKNKIWINPETEFYGVTYDRLTKKAFIQVSEKYLQPAGSDKNEDRSTREKQLSLKQIQTTLNDVYRDLESVVFVINNNEYLM